MNAKSKSSTGFAVFEGSPLTCREFGLSLEEAFHSVMAHSSDELVWHADDRRVTLCFRYLERPFRKTFVHDGLSGSNVMQFERDLYVKNKNKGPAYARSWIMQRVLEARLCGWQGMRMDHFYIHHTKAKQVRRESRGIPRTGTSAEKKKQPQRTSQ
jgi:hypothetical protein